MSKEEKRLIEESKPLQERNYWKLQKELKNQWLDYYRLSKMKDIVLPIIIQVLDIFSFGFLIGLLALPKPTSVLVFCVFLFIIVIPVCIWYMYFSIDQYKGLFLFRYWKKKSYSGPNPPPSSSKQANNKKLEEVEVLDI